MKWLDIGLIGSLIFAAYYFQQIKITLKEKGYPVYFFTGWFSDYQKFKKLLLEETPQDKKIQYQGILNGLHLAIAGFMVIGVLIFSGK